MPEEYLKDISPCSCLAPCLQTFSIMSHLNSSKSGIFNLTWNDVIEVVKYLNVFKLFLCEANTSSLYLLVPVSTR